MMRHVAPLTLTLTVLIGAMPIACDKPGATERQKEEQANEQLAQAKNEAAQRTQAAQATAEKDINVARANFEKSREDYRHMRTSDLTDVDKKTAELDAKAKTATGKSKSDLEDSLAMIRANREAFVRQLQDLDRATPAAWDEAKLNLERAWTALKAAVDKAK